MDLITIEQARSPTEEVRDLIDGLETELAEHYPPEQRHGLALEALFAPHIRFFICRLNGAAAGCGGVAFFPAFAAVKRMYVRPASRGQGIAQALLARLEAETRAAGLKTLRLETGIHQPAAIRVYQKAGFVPCPAFGDYLRLPPAALVTSLFFEKLLPPAP